MCITVNAMLILQLFLFFLLSSITESHKWDHIVFTQSWPPAVCKSFMQSGHTSACRFPRNPAAWSIHGIWPSTFGTMSPAFCNLTWVYNPKKVKTIKPQLAQGWTKIPVAAGSELDLWAHEWSKHGTCASDVEAFDSIYKYFSTGLELLQNYTMTDILSNADITPSNTYSYKDIYNAVLGKLGAIPDIRCLHLDGKYLLWEVRICFSRELDLVNCKLKQPFVSYMLDDSVNVSGNCGSGDIYYIPR